jgi:hypothetical protein
MKDQKLHECFESLENRLYQLKLETNTLEGTTQDYIIKNIVDKGIFSCNLEDSEDEINRYDSRIDDMISKMPSIIQNFSSDKFFVNIKREKAELKKNKIAELKFYKAGLSNIKDQIQERITAQGSDRFSLAARKINLKLTNGEIGCLFNALYMNKIIDHVEQNGSKLTKEMLADYITKNFTTQNHNPISIKSMKNLLSNSDKAAENKVIDLLEKLLSYLRS